MSLQIAEIPTIPEITKRITKMLAKSAKERAKSMAHKTKKVMSPYSADARAKGAINKKNDDLDFRYRPDPNDETDQTMCGFTTLYEAKIKGYTVDMTPFKASIQPAKMNDTYIWQHDTVLGIKKLIEVLPATGRHHG